MNIVTDLYWFLFIYWKAREKWIWNYGEEERKKTVMENYIVEDETGWSHIMIWEVIYDVKQIRRSEVM